MRIEPDEVEALTMAVLKEANYDSWVAYDNEEDYPESLYNIIEKWLEEHKITVDWSYN
jgi:hypothetical protein